VKESFSALLPRCGVDEDGAIAAPDEAEVHADESRADARLTGDIQWTALHTMSLACGHKSIEGSGGEAYVDATGWEMSRKQSNCCRKRILQDQILFFRVNYWVLLEMASFIPPNPFFGVGKHHIFGKKI
jgi:hypothetical protein